MRGNFLLLELADVAASQWGMVTTAQARAVGFTPQQVAALCRAGTVQRLRHGVYRLAGVAEDRWMGLRAAWLALDPTMMVVDRLAQEAPEVVSHRSAALLHGVGDLDADVWEFTVANRRQSRRRDTRFHVGELGRGDWTVVGGLPVTTVLVTIGDLAAARIDGGHLAGVVRDAVVTCHLDVGAVAAVLRPYAHHYGAPLGDGVQLVEEFLAEAGVPTSTVAVGELVGRQRAAALPQGSGWSMPLAADVAAQLQQVIAEGIGRDLAPFQDALRAATASSAASIEAVLRVLNSPAMRAGGDQAVAVADSVRQVRESSGMHAEAQRAAAAVAAAAAELEVLGKAGGWRTSPAGGRTS